MQGKELVGENESERIMRAWYGIGIRSGSTTRMVWVGWGWVGKMSRGWSK